MVSPRTCLLSEGAVGVWRPPAFGHGEEGLYSVHILTETGHKAVALAQIVVIQGQVEVLKGVRQGVVALHVRLTIQVGLKMTAALNWLFYF